jgi:hypothetical protein
MANAKSSARTLNDFRAAHDRDVIVPRKIKDALATMAKKHREHFEYESDFVKLAGISQTDLGAFREQFADHVVVTANVHGKSSKRVWFATAAAAKAARRE